MVLMAVLFESQSSLLCDRLVQLNSTAKQAYGQGKTV